MTHKPGHKTSPHYDKLTDEQKKRFNWATSPDFFNPKTSVTGKNGPNSPND